MDGEPGSDKWLSRLVRRGAATSPAAPVEVCPDADVLASWVEGRLPRDAQAMAEHLGTPLAEAIGAGDTEMDRFLSGVGCAVVVGNQRLQYRGLRETLQVPSSPAFGELLFCLAELQRSAGS